MIFLIGEKLKTDASLKLAPTIIRWLTPQ
eukprot:SAG11_NODE_47484_length_129_cov_46.133333_1_plen_28_part_01